MTKKIEWVSYDPSWLVKLAEAQKPSNKWLSESLRKCTKAIKVSLDTPYLYFVDNTNANKDGSDWQFKTNVTLDSEEEGWLILDILQDNKVGGVEFYNRL